MDDDDLWEQGFNQLVEYVKSSGDARVPGSYIAADGFKLGQWVARQRANHARNVIEYDRADRLQSLPGWVWDASKKQEG